MGVGPGGVMMYLDDTTKMVPVWSLIADIWEFESNFRFLDPR